jgi:SAM-dependent methyltransferase
MSNRLELQLKELGLKPSISEENGLGLIRDTDLSVFSPGISTGGFAEIRMALANPNRKIIATTIDQKGLDYANKNIEELGLSDRVQTRLEDLTKEYPYPNEFFDFIYARLVLHYLSFQELNKVLAQFRGSLKMNGELFVVVRSVKNLDGVSGLEYNSETKMTTEIYRNAEGKIVGHGQRYFHSPESISSHLNEAGLGVVYLREYQEQLYEDFMRTRPVVKKDEVIEMLAIAGGCGIES